MPVEIASVTVKLRRGTFPFLYEARTRTEIEEILTGRVYPKIPFLENVRVVVDAGGSFGAAAVFFADVYPKATVFSFEPHLQSFEIAVANTAGIDTVRLFNVGLHEADQTAELFIGAQTHSTNSVFAGAPYNTDQTATVQIRKATDQLAEIGIKDIDVLKIDTEGCEVPILRDLLAVYAPKAVHFEYHSEPDRRQLDAMLTPDYIVFSGTAAMPHLGTMTYVRNDAFPSAAVRDRWAVSLQRAKD
ncbi:MAG: FkbM family methyltransferase [Kiloniellaceae bacterium]